MSPAALFAFIEADFLREYGIDLLQSDMSWRRFCVLYGGLSRHSAAFRNYDRIAKKAGIRKDAAERSAWDALIGLGKPSRSGFGQEQ